MRTCVAVVFGGASVEREVSIVSARTIVGNLSPEKYAVRPVAIDPRGRVRTEDDSRRILERGFEAAAAVSEGMGPDRFSGVDIVFPIIHGETGEDGTLQGFLETLGIPYVGSGVAASALGMNKAAFKARMREAGLPVAPSVAFRLQAWETSAGSMADLLARKLSLPVFVKPSGGGSSLGVSKVKSWEDLAGAVALASEYDSTILAEQGIEAREIECAILGNDDARASGCGEIVPGREFYDYEDKYLGKTAKLLIPAPLEERTVETIRAIAREAFLLCGCSGLARVDFFVGKRDAAVYLNELNTLPGFTSISMYPKLWERDGIALAELLETLIRLGFDRHKQKAEDARRRRAPPKLS